MEIAINAKIAANQLMGVDSKQRKLALINIANFLNQKKDRIISENEKDILKAKKDGLNSAMIDRLKLDHKRIEQMIEGVMTIANAPEIVGQFFDECKSENGLIIKKQSIPIGVILMIFESRPNVVIDCAALAIKSSNAILLKGGKEAFYTNQILGEVINMAIDKVLPQNSIQVLASDDKAQISDLLNLNQYIDVVIPRGGQALINYVSQNARMPVIAHFQGLCHIFIDKSAIIDKACKIVVNAKTQRPGVCNSIETLLIHKEILKETCEKIITALVEKKTEIRGCKEFLKLCKKHNFKEATDLDWCTEYLDNILSVKVVNNLDEAITHIRKYGSHHTEGIITEDEDSKLKFLNQVDASCIVINSSTRFNDGGELGLGAELGISTTKIHAYGPMGAQQMTTSRWVVIGNGHIRN